MKVWQKTVSKVVSQRSNKADDKPNADLHENDDILNPNLQMGFANRAVSMEMETDSGYMGLQRPSDGYEQLQKPQNPVREIQDSDEYMVPKDQSDEYMIPKDQSDVYEEIQDSTRY